VVSWGWGASNEFDAAYRVEGAAVSWGLGRKSLWRV
jgi:hypothetical protein